MAYCLYGIEGASPSVSALWRWNILSEFVCGVDVHRDLLVAAMVDDSLKGTKRFANDVDGINSLKEWLKGSECNRVVMESTGVYWVCLYLALEDAGFDVSLANPGQVKAIPGRKTDQSDSEWLAHLLRSGLVKPSYVPEKRLRELRDLTRLRVKLVATRTAFKNRCHKVLNRVNIRLGSRLSDIFGKAGLEILEGLMEGESVDDILEHTENRWLKKRGDEIKEVVKGVLSESDIFILKQCVDMVKQVEGKILEVDGRIEALVNERDVEIVASVPGVGRKSAAAITAEIGDARRFESGKKLVSAAGLAPSVYQSAGKNLTGSITKRGSRWLRRSMVEAAHSAVKARDSELRRFYLRVKSRKGEKTAIVAVARKMLVIIHHLLVNGERYVEDGFEKKLKGRRSILFRGVPLEDMAVVLRNAGYVVSGPFGGSFG
jgi:transposase